MNLVTYLGEIIFPQLWDECPTVVRRLTHPGE